MPRFRLKFLLQEIDLPIGETTIGRSPQCTITIEDPLVSRKHALIKVTEEEAIFRDLGSRNGSFINGEPITHEVVLKDGDRIRIGTQEFIFHKIETKERRTKSTGSLRYCKYCKIPFPEGAKICPHCGKVVEETNSQEPEYRCPKCNLILDKNETYCPRCSIKLYFGMEDTFEEKEDYAEKTVKIDLLSITQHNWAYDLLYQSINKALKEQKYTYLKRLIEHFKNQIERDASFDPKRNRNMLASVFIGSFKLFEMTNNEEELYWIFNFYSNNGITLQEKELNLLIELYNEGRKLNMVLSNYYNKLISQKREYTEEEVKLMDMLYRLIES